MNRFWIFLFGESRCQSQSYSTLLTPLWPLTCAFILLGAQVGLSAQGTESARSPGPQSVDVSLSDYHEVFYIARQGSDDQGVGSRERPWATVEKAATVLRPIDNGHRRAVLVAAGTYPTMSVELPPNVDWFGGYNPQSWDRDVSAHTTRLSGQNRDRLLIVTTNCRIDGFTLSEGRANGPGGALVIDGVDPVITNNVFLGNTTAIPADFRPVRQAQQAHPGGAIVSLHRSAPTIEHNLFCRNSTEVGNGGAISFLYVTGRSDRKRPRVAFNVFIENRSGLRDPGTRSSNGGAFSCSYGPAPVLEKNVFVDNFAGGHSDGGACYVEYWSKPLLRNNWLVGNTCDDDGGGIYVCHASHVTLDGNFFAGNRTMLGGGDVRLSKEGRATLVNNVFTDSTTRGALVCKYSWMRVINNTFAGNMLGRIHYDNESEHIVASTFVNNIVWGKSALPFYSRAAPTAPLIMKHCLVGPAPYQSMKDIDFTNRIEGTPQFIDDGISGSVRVTAGRTLGQSALTIISINHGSNHAGQPLPGRVVRVGDRWGVVSSGTLGEHHTLAVWGNLSSTDSTSVPFECVPTYHLGPSSPCVDQGTRDHAPTHDRDGDPRSSGPVDIGADERA